MQLPGAAEERPGRFPWKECRPCDSQSSDMLALMSGLLLLVIIHDNLRPCQLCRLRLVGVSETATGRSRKRDHHQSVMIARRPAKHIPKRSVESRPLHEHDAERVLRNWSRPLVSARNPCLTHTGAARNSLSGETTRHLWAPDPVSRGPCQLAEDARGHRKVARRPAAAAG